MPRRYRNRSFNTRSGLASFLRKPAVQFAIVAFIAFIVYLIAAGGNVGGNKLPSEISVDDAYARYKSGAFVLDVRTQQEWDEYHAPNTILIPLDQLQSRLNELPKDKEIVVVCSSSNCSQQGRDILLAAGLHATSMSGGMKEWYVKGYDIEGAPLQ